MKNSLKVFAIGLLIVGATFISLNLNAQPNSPPPPSGHGEQGDQLPGGGAPIGSGLFILLSLGAAYGGKKIYVYKKNLG
ncbi:MAG: hypothetical protein JEY97_16105 [Bacteroidales bacterium]|nr:hypothetical protein [Bacteroidales bacterium]